MRPKIFFAIICAACLLVTGCGGSSSDDKTSGDAVKLGTIAGLNSDESKFGEFLDKLDGTTKHQPKFYDSLKTMQLGIESGEIDQIGTYRSVANYLTAANKNFEIVPNDALNKISDHFCFAVRKDDTALKAELDKAIDAMKADGTLDKLIDEHITNATTDNLPRVDMPTFDGAPTIKIGVTGDLPPLDYVSADGKAAGFNTAMLAEIAKRTGKNLEIVDIDGGARATALTSKIIDVVFWVVVPFGKDMPADIDKPEGLELSAPYFKDDVAHVKLKK